MTTSPPPSFATADTSPAPSLAEEISLALDKIRLAPGGRFKLSYQALDTETEHPFVRFCAEPLPSEFGTPDFSGDLDATDDAALAALRGLASTCTLEEFRSALGAFAKEI
jgi:hypothetical protein